MFALDRIAGKLSENSWQRKTVQNSAIENGASAKTVYATPEM